MKDYRIVGNPTATGFYLKLNHKAAPTDDIHVRKAIAYAVDYKTVRDVLYPGIELRGPLPSALGDAYASDLPAPEFNLEKAKAELKQSKYAAGGKIPLVHTYIKTLQFEEELALHAEGVARRDRLRRQAAARAVEPHHRARQQTRDLAGE